ncbi:MAG: hypothetical protein WA957_16840 [Alteraurantiacibacter sp.]
MQEPKSSNKTLWLMVIALLAVAAIIFVINPTRGEDEAAMEAAVEQASIDRDDTLNDYPVDSESYSENAPMSEDADVELVIPEGEETGDLELGENVTVAD